MRPRWIFNSPNSTCIPSTCCLTSHLGRTVQSSLSFPFFTGVYSRREGLLSSSAGLVHCLRVAQEKALRHIAHLSEEEEHFETPRKSLQSIFHHLQALPHRRWRWLKARGRSTCISFKTFSAFSCPGMKEHFISSFEGCGSYYQRRTMPQQRRMVWGIKVMTK